MIRPSRDRRRARWRHAYRIAVLVAWLVAPAACSLLVNTSGLGGGDDSSDASSDSPSPDRASDDSTVPGDSSSSSSSSSGGSSSSSNGSSSSGSASSSGSSSSSGSASSGGSSSSGSTSSGGDASIRDSSEEESSAPTDSSTAEAGVCSAGTTRCVTNAVEICGPNGQWGTSVGCTNQTCVDGGCAGQCAPGQKTCSGTTLQTCNPSGQWQTEQACAVACCGSACVDTNTDPNHCGSCSVACAAGYACGASFSAFTGTQPAGWTSNGNATYDSPDQAAQLTDLNTNEAGTWIYNNAIQVDSVTFQFDFSISGGFADGMGFILETDGPAAVGLDSAGLGMAGLNGWGVELDEFNNMQCLDSNGNHIGIDMLHGCMTAFPNTLTVNNNPGFNISDGNWHTLVVNLNGGAFTVTGDGMSIFTPYTPAGWTNNPYYFGFAGGTGGGGNYHRVRNVSVTYATPHCY